MMKTKMGSLGAMEALELTATLEKAQITYLTGIKLVVIMASLLLGTALMALDTTIISVATPTITAQFHALNDIGWWCRLPDDFNCYNSNQRELLQVFQP
jgi:hypothetical protein